MIRRWLGLCENRHHTFTEFRCKLGYGHGGQCYFGYAQCGNLTLNLDAPPIVPVSQPPDAPATPVPPPADQSWLEVKW